MERSMITRPRPNRVTPFAAIEASAAKGLFLGNRGDLHATDGNLSSRRWALKAWICCTLSPKSGNRIEFDRKGTYYPLFFADEATAFAAGHRPCAMCRHPDYQRFKRHWHLAMEIDQDRFISIKEIDEQLQAARVDSVRQQVTYRAELGALPDGSMVVQDAEPESARLLCYGKTWRWSQSGYDDERPVAACETVSVLTPAPFVRVFQTGYRPVVRLPPPE
jgi:hypothetical protein